MDPPEGKWSYPKGRYSGPPANSMDQKKLSEAKNNFFAKYGMGNTAAEKSDDKSSGFSNTTKNEL